MELTEREKGMSRNLFQQVHKNMTFQNKNQGKAGIAKYRSSLRSFCDYLAKEYGMRNLRNISNKHLRGYVEHRQEMGIKDVRTELSAIRKFHSTMSNAKYQLEKNNKVLGVEDRKKVEDGRAVVDRAWTQKEYEKACQLARERGFKDVSTAFSIARYAGLRVNEVTALTKSQIREGLTHGRFTVTHAKGGIERTSRVDSVEYRNVLKEAFENARSEQVFIEHGLNHKQMNARIQNFVYRNREYFTHQDVQADDRERSALTFHGLRHSYARERFERNLSKGMSEKQARSDVAACLGHGRDEVTKIYL